ncbi:MAG: hypothetical protein U0746_17265 [Gemmataceae bacterium]
MVTALLVDANLDGHADLLAARLQSDLWREFRDYLNIHILHFEDVPLDRDATDEAVWRLCQERGYWLLTANRNHESADSLEAAIRREGTADSIPVLTLADPQRALQGGAYLDRVVERLLVYLLNPEQYRGTGRLYLP